MVDLESHFKFWINFEVDPSIEPPPHIPFSKNNYFTFPLFETDFEYIYIYIYIYMARVGIGIIREAGFYPLAIIFFLIWEVAF